MSTSYLSDGESESNGGLASEDNYTEYISTEIDELFEAPSKTYFVKYKPLDSCKEYRVHPGAEIVEAYPLSFVKPPMPSENDLRIPDNGELTTVQMDALRLASAKFKEKFPETGVTKGFLLADGPGLGKTRILAAIIYNEYLSGYKRHVFLSISDILFQDVLSEFAKIATEEWANNHVRTLEQLESTLQLQEFKGVLLMTYHRLRKSGATGSTPSLISRLSGIDVIKNFCGREKKFAGVIALDESHVGKNALNPIFDLRSTTGRIMLNVLDSYKNAKVIYSTATPASNTNHLGIMSRLGIWGPEKYFTEFEKFDKLMSKWELSAAEIMALVLKQEGAMVCRQISFEGVKTSAQYVPTISEPHDFRESYDKFSDMWRRMYKDMGIIAGYCDPDSKKTKIATFFSALMNFFRALIIDSKINHLVEMIKKEIRKDNVVVVGIQGTGESSYADYKKNEQREDLISNAREIMEKLVKNHFCVAMHSRKRKRNSDDGSEECSNSNGDESVASADPTPTEATEGSTLEEDLYISASDADDDDDESAPALQHQQSSSQNQREKTILYSGLSLECKDIPEVNKIRQYWLDEIRKIQHMPPNFLDEIRRRLSEFDNITVAEITGRRQQLLSKDGRYELVDRPIDCDLERKRFMEGTANVAIISDAGSTGISLHASNAQENFCKKLRVHITVELGWSAEKVLQQLGRTNRANQKQPPEYIFLLSNVPAEIRFTSIILGRLATMSTFTCAQRHVDLCDRLEEQAKYDSNAGIRGIRAALAFFFDEDVPIEYEKDVHLKCKVASQLNYLGLTTSKKEKNSFVKTQGRTLKRISLTKIMNKLLGCSLDVQEVFCDVWLFYLTYYKLQYMKDHGVVVVDPDVCTVMVEEDETLILRKHEKQEGVITSQLTSTSNANSGIDNHEESSGESDSGNMLNESQPLSHGPICLLTLHACLGSSPEKIKKLYEAAADTDKISGFYDDGNFQCLKKRHFYLENKFLTEDSQKQLFTQKEMPEELMDKKVCLLHQPHQPPIHLTGEKVVEFLNCMKPEPNGLLALSQWLMQATALKDICIHKYRRGPNFCESPKCSRGKRHDLKCVVTGDLPAIWPDIVSVLHDEDPLVVVFKDACTGTIHVGVEIPKHAIKSLRLKVASHDFYKLGV